MSNNKANYFIYIFVFFLLFLGLILYYYFFRGLVVAAYEGNAPIWFTSIIDLIYPRFAVEKNRFDLNFFLSKADQVILRSTGICIIALIFNYLWQYNALFKQKLTAFWSKETSLTNVIILRKMFALIFMFCVWDWMFVFQNFAKISVFYEPVFLLRILGLGFPSESVSIGLNILLLLGIILLFLGIWVVEISVLLAFLFIILQGYLHSFHKLDHTFATFTYLVTLMPFLLATHRKSKKANQAMQAGWALWLMQVAIVTVYFLAGIEKILIGGLDWFAVSNLKTHLLIHQADWGLWVAQYDFLVVLLSIGAVVFEVAFVGILFFPKYKLGFLLVGVLFHIGTFILLNVGGFPTPWTMTYVFFIDWGKVFYGKNPK